MKRLLKSWVFWVFVTPVTAGVFFSVEFDSDHYQCRCASKMRATTWRLGFQEFGWRFGASREVSPSRLTWEVLPASHVHAWAWRHGKRDGAVLSLLRCGGDAPITGFAQTYEVSPEFRGWLREEMSAGRLDADAVEAAVTNPATQDDFVFGWTPP